MVIQLSIVTDCAKTPTRMKQRFLGSVGRRNREGMQTLSARRSLNNGGEFVVLSSSDGAWTSAILRQKLSYCLNQTHRGTSLADSHKTWWFAA